MIMWFQNKNEHQQNNKQQMIPQARTAIRNMFLGLREKESSLLIPWCTYTEPEIAHVGLYEKEMEDRGIK